MGAGVRSLPCFVAGLVIALTLPGCQKAPPRVLVKGQLLDNGKPLKMPKEGLPPGDKGIQVTFYRLSEAGAPGEQFEAVVNPDDSTFEVPGLEGKGLAPGKYRISVTEAAYGAPDKLKGAFSKDKSQITREVAESAAPMTIDLSKPTG